MPKRSEIACASTPETVSSRKSILTSLYCPQTTQSVCDKPVGSLDMIVSLRSRAVTLFPFAGISRAQCTDRSHCNLCLEHQIQRKRQSQFCLKVKVVEVTLCHIFVPQRVHHYPSAKGQGLTSMRLQELAVRVSQRALKISTRRGYFSGANGLGVGSRPHPWITQSRVVA